MAKNTAAKTVTAPAVAADEAPAIVVHVGSKNMAEVASKHGISTKGIPERGTAPVAVLGRINRELAALGLGDRVAGNEVQAKAMADATGGTVHSVAKPETAKVKTVSYLAVDPESAQFVEVRFPSDEVREALGLESTAGRISAAALGEFAKSDRGQELIAEALAASAEDAEDAEDAEEAEEAEDAEDADTDDN